MSTQPYKPNATARSIQDLLAALIRTPSQALTDDLANVVQVIRGWLDDNGVPHTITGPADKPLAIVINPPPAGADDELFVLNACVDTAPTGDLSQWQHQPFAATIEDGWMFGRGSSDSKAAVAIFCHIAKTTALNAKKPKPGARQRRVSIVFDCDEHSGRFGGIHSYTQTYGFPAHCAIGYPGQHEIVNGSRGFHRTTVTLRGAMGHSGADTVPAELAADKLQLLLAAVSAFNRRRNTMDPAFPLPPRATVTGLRTGAKTHSVTAARIEVLLDIRLTPTFDAAAAQAWLDKALATIAKRCGNAYPSQLSRVNTWPPYRTPTDALLPRLLQQAAASVLGAPPPLVVCGPSNIGNLLAASGTHVLSGFGVEFRNAHGPDERVKLSSIPAVYETYRAAVKAYLGGAV